MKNNLREFLKQNRTVETKLGELTVNELIGEGGNSLVYTGVLNKKEIAIKFLTEDRTSKLQRFKAEYFNIIYALDNYKYTKYINFESAIINDTPIHYIIMKRYSSSLKRHVENTNQTEKELLNLFEFLCQALGEAHRNGIIHRDIKPENILVTDQGDFVLADFGIAYYNPELYELKADTNKSERLSNYDFSAPEQSEKNCKPTKNMDIYALGQICQWYCFKKVHKGTQRNRFYDVYKSNEILALDSVVNKCLNNNPDLRYASIEELKADFEKLCIPIIKYEECAKHINSFNNALLKVTPDAFYNPLMINDFEKIKLIFDSLNDICTESEINYNTGKINNKVVSIKLYPDSIVVFDEIEISIEKIWVYLPKPSYKGFLIIEAKNNEYVQIDNEMENRIAIITIDNQHYSVPACKVTDGNPYIEIEKLVYNVSELNFEIRDKKYYSKYYFIGSSYHCVNVMKNDSVLDKYQKYNLDTDKIIALSNEIIKNKNKTIDSFE